MKAQTAIHEMISDNVDKYQKRLQDLLDTTGAKLVRRKKHMIYEFANGRMVSVSTTPSDQSSYKKAYSDVRRIAAIPMSEDTVPNADAPERASTERKARFRAPVRDQDFREDPGIIVVPFTGSTVQPSSVPEPQIRFESVSELVSVADEVGSFWQLNSDGRTRVLMKLAQGFGEVDVIGTRSYKTSFRGFQWYMFNASTRDPLLLLYGFDWPMLITRSLYIKTPDGRVQLVETESKKVLEGMPQIVVISVGDKQADMEERAMIETVDDFPEPELSKYVFHHFISALKMQHRGLSFAATKEWLDPQVTRRVGSEMLEFLAEHRKRQMSLNSEVRGCEY